MHGQIPTFASHSLQPLKQMLDVKNHYKPNNSLVELKLTFENELSRNRGSNVKFAPLGARHGFPQGR